MSTTVVSWNIGKRQGPWHQLADMGAAVALLQRESDNRGESACNRK